jgi:MFS family permease
MVVLAGMLIARTSVSLQYQGITILGVSLGGNDVMAAGDIGVLLALYPAFGLAASIVSPLIVQRFGMAIPVRLALLMMAIGQFAMLQPASYTWLVACRTLTGVGGSLIYVITLEGVAGISNLGSLAIRMGLIAATWPLGSALSLVIMPLLGGVVGLPVAMSLPIWTVAIAMLFLAWSTRESPPPVSGATPAQAIGPFLRSWGATMGRTWPVGLSFALYNSAFVLFTCFSVKLFLEQGYSVSSAEQLASIPMWMFLISVPAGGLLSAFLRTHDRALIVAGTLSDPKTSLTIYSVAACPDVLPQFLSTIRPTTLPERSSSIHFWTSPIGSSLIGVALILPERASAISSCASARVPTMKPSMVIRL